MKSQLRSCKTLLLLLLVPTCLLAQEYPPLSLSLDLVGQNASAGSNSSFGVGGQFWADYRFAPLISIGSGLSTMSYSGFSTASWDLGGDCG